MASLIISTLEQGLTGVTSLIETLFKAVATETFLKIGLLIILSVLYYLPLTKILKKHGTGAWTDETNANKPALAIAIILSVLSVVFIPAEILKLYMILFSLITIILLILLHGYLVFHELREPTKFNYFIKLLATAIMLVIVSVLYEKVGLPDLIKDLLAYYILYLILSIFYYIIRLLIPQGGGQQGDGNMEQGGGGENPPNIPPQEPDEGEGETEPNPPIKPTEPIKPIEPTPEPTPHPTPTPKPIKPVQPGKTRIKINIIIAKIKINIGHERFKYVTYLFMEATKSERKKILNLFFVNLDIKIIIEVLNFAYYSVSKTIVEEMIFWYFISETKANIFRLLITLRSALKQEDFNKILILLRKIAEENKKKKPYLLDYLDEFEKILHEKSESSGATQGKTKDAAKLLTFEPGPLGAEKLKEITKYILNAKTEEEKQRYYLFLFTNYKRDEKLYILHYLINTLPKKEVRIMLGIMFGTVRGINDMNGAYTLVFTLLLDLKGKQAVEFLANVKDVIGDKPFKSLLFFIAENIRNITPHSRKDEILSYLSQFIDPSEFNFENS